MGILDTEKEQREPVNNLWGCLIIIAAAITWLGSQIDILLMMVGFILVFVFMIPVVKNSRQ